MIITGNIPNNLGSFSNKKFFENNNVSFTAATPKLYEVKNTNAFKKVLPTLAFTCSVLGSLGYLIGGVGLFYDVVKSKQNKNGRETKPEEGVKTVTPTTKFGKIGLVCGKSACLATSVAGIACGIGEGIPLMALGEATNVGASRILETPVGTGLFGVGIASIFAGLALDNTPELKLNQFDLMAEKGLAKKTVMILKNMGKTAKEISGSIFEIAKNIFNFKFLKENILQGTPKTVVFSESINKDGKVILSKMLRHNKNYVMHAASFTLAIGGLGIVASSFLHKKKSEKNCLVIEEGGFLFDNLGITRYGLDKLTTNGKPAGVSFAVGGVINAISQFMGLDNKDGRAMQWLGISLVFLGFAIDRGKHLKENLKLAKQRPELARVVREWKVDLSKLIKNSDELKKLQKEIKADTPDKQTITNETFLKLEKAFHDSVGVEDIQATADVQGKLRTALGKDIFDSIRESEFAGGFEKAKQVLQTCTEKIFGSKNPVAIGEEAV